MYISTKNNLIYPTSTHAVSNNIHVRTCRVLTQYEQTTLQKVHPSIVCMTFGRALHPHWSSIHFIQNHGFWNKQMGLVSLMCISHASPSYEKKSKKCLVNIVPSICPQLEYMNYQWDCMIKSHDTIKACSLNNIPYSRKIWRIGRLPEQPPN